MEPKVVAGCIASARRSGAWGYDERRCVVEASGSANNWAHGYLTHPVAVREALLDTVRAEVEACDAFDGFLCLHSVAGGTGSGLGTYVTETLRDEFADGCVFNAPVWPYESGEVIVQHYNAVLTMAHVCEAADAVLLMRNDALSEVCRRMLHVKSPSFDDLNAVAARCLAQMLLPSHAWAIDGRADLEADAEAEAAAQAGGEAGAEGEASDARVRDGGAGGGRGGGGDVEEPGIYDVEGAAGVRVSSADASACTLAPLSAAARHLCPHPGYKLLNARLIPQMPASSVAFASHSWPGLLKHVLQMQAEGAQLEEGLRWHQAIADLPPPPPPAPSHAYAHTLHAARASGAGSGWAGASATPALAARMLIPRDVNRSVAAMLLLRGPDAASADVRAFLDPHRALYAAWSPEPLLVSSHARPFAGYEKSAAVISNDASVAPLLDRTLTRAHGMFEARAYVHQYEEHGLGAGDMEEALARVEQVLSNYASL